MKIAFWGDTHVGKLTKLVGDDGLKLHRRLFALLLRETRRIDARHVVILGDVFASPFPSQDDLSLVIDILSEASDIKFIVLKGNHDEHSADNNSLKLLQRLPRAGALTNVRFFTKQETRIHWAGLDVLVIPFGAKHEHQSDINLVLFHDAVVGAKRDNGTTVIMGEGIPSTTFGRALAVGGHLHTKQNLGNVYFPGTQAQLSFGETLPKRFSWLDTSDMRVHGVEFDPPWRLEQVSWSADDPPCCDKLDTYYQMRIGDERPGPRWLAEHTRVVSVRGASKKMQKRSASTIIRLVQGGFVKDESEEQLLKRWLKEFSPLDGLSIMKALRVHGRLGG
jgi:DNA repair exonuclease SbcCD nuclease subunit